ncbi:MAG TPA: IS200/IS605 family transposase [Cyanobacteria bacterium UBA8803]|nr:IS200/IS605 family transposase [Cyanobacteria bacterium UBA9273]HBL59133.1 IS200/IS605 family transposase [Cyanobacteria bacterium UBA8803]
MALWRLYYHLVWGTKQRQPLINPEIETVLYPYLLGKADGIDSIIHAIGGIEDHIHLVVSIPPALSISDFVKTLKGSSAYHLNHRFATYYPQFGWQEGYGVFSLGGKQLEQAVTYVENQKVHHLNGSAIKSLEDSNHLDDAPSRWFSG